MLLSYIIPCYASSGTLRAVVDEIDALMGSEPKLSAYQHEIILINDCSPDSTEDVIRGLCRERAHLTGICFTRNFGQHAALMAGLNQATGDMIICLDDDGQTPANEAAKLVQALLDGADAVYARYDRKHRFGIRRLGSYLNDLMMRIMLGKPKHLYLSSYFAVRSFIADEIKRYGGAYPYVIGLVLRSTKNIVNVDVVHRERMSGTSGYTMKKLLALWFDGFTAFSVKPLRIATLIGAIIAFTGFIYAAYIVINRIFFYPDALQMGIASIVAAVLVLGGLIILMLGLVGEYIGRMYITLNNSPQYVIRETIPPS